MKERKKNNQIFQIFQIDILKKKPKGRGHETATLPVLFFLSFLEICIYQSQIFLFTSYIYIQPTLLTNSTH